MSNPIKIDEDMLETGPRGVEDNWYKGAPFTGIAFRNDESGMKIAEATYVDGIVDGLEREFYTNGYVKSETPFSRGLRNGTSKHFYDDGTIMKEQRFESGMKILEIEYSKEGLVVSKWVVSYDDPLYAAYIKSKSTKS